MQRNSDFLKQLWTLKAYSPIHNDRIVADDPSGYEPGGVYGQRVERSFERTGVEAGPQVVQTFRRVLQHGASEKRRQLASYNSSGWKTKSKVVVVVDRLYTGFQRLSAKILGKQINN